MNLAPFLDYNNALIYEGDRLRHPDGMIGTAKLCRGTEVGRATVDYDWYLDYDNDIAGLLLLQVGEKGQAVVVQ